VGGQIGRGNKTTWPSYGFAGGVIEGAMRKSPHLLRMGNYSRLRKPYGPRATTKITMTTLRSPGLAGGANSRHDHEPLPEDGGQIGNRG